MLVNKTSTPSPNPFNMNPSPASGSASTTFTQQLSNALEESLRKFGTGSGDVNITIRNAPNSQNPQILISYSAPQSAAAQLQPGTTTRPAGTQTPAPAPPAAQPEPHLILSNGNRTRVDTPWAVTDDSQDRRDQVCPGGGRVTASGAPLIEISDTPAANQYNYTGAAARNPYFTTPSNPLREGYVLGFENWFVQPYILGGKNGPMPANKLYYATEEGAREALRLVQQYVPGAEITHSTWTSGPFAASIPMYQIRLPNGERLSAGAMLNSYYYGGYGVTAASDNNLKAGLLALSSNLAS